MSITSTPCGAQTVNYCIRCEPHLMRRHSAILTGIVRNPGLCRECAPKVKQELQGKMSQTWKAYMNAAYGPIGQLAL